MVVLAERMIGVKTREKDNNNVVLVAGLLDYLLDHKIQYHVVIWYNGDTRLACSKKDLNLLVKLF